MKYEVECTADVRIIKEVMCHEVLFKASMPDEDIELYKYGRWEPAMNCQYLVFKRLGKPVAIIRLFELSNITVDMHVHLLPKYWGKGTSEKLNKYVEQWLTDNTKYCKIVIQTPQCCSNVLKAAVREGYELEGMLTAGICWRGSIESIVLMAKHINRRENNG